VHSVLEATPSLPVNLSGDSVVLLCQYILEMLTTTTTTQFENCYHPAYFPKRRSGFTEQFSLADVYRLRYAAV
jgi:hypothetical protein